MKQKTKKNLSSQNKLDEADKEKIIEELLPYIKYTALRLTWRLPQQLTIDDLMSAGIVGLLEAMNRYNENEGKISTFVKYRIKGAMLDEIDRFSPISKSQKIKIQMIGKICKQLEKSSGSLPEDVEIAEALNLTLDDYYEVIQDAQVPTIFSIEEFSERQINGEEVSLTEIIPDKSSMNPIEKLEERDKNRWLAGIIDELPEKEKLILSLYYRDELTMREISQVIDMTEGRVCQLHNKALIWMRARLGDRSRIKDFF